jgi:hypothetical protein
MSPSLSADLQQWSVRQYTGEHREQWLLVFAWGHLRDNDLLGASPCRGTSACMPMRSRMLRSQTPWSQFFY